MSNKATQENKPRPLSDSSQQALRESRETLETIAESDLPTSWIAEELLALIEDSRE